MARTRFVLTRHPDVNASGGIYTIDKTLSSGEELQIDELVVSSDKNNVIFEVLYTEDNGTTWINPWDNSADIIVRLHLNSGIPFGDNKVNYNFVGGTNRKLRIKITNNNAANANVSYTVKGKTI